MVVVDQAAEDARADDVRVIMVRDVRRLFDRVGRLLVAGLVGAVLGRVFKSGYVG